MPEDWEDQSPQPANFVKPGEPLDPTGYDIATRVRPSERIHLSAEEMAAFLVVFVADVADQMTDVTSWSERLGGLGLGLGLGVAHGVARGGCTCRSPMSKCIAGAIRVESSFARAMQESGAPTTATARR